MRRAPSLLGKKSRGRGCAANPIPGSVSIDEDGLRPTVPSACDLSVLRREVDLVLQELYIALTCIRG